MAKIVLSEDAPKGQPLSAAFGPSSFDAGNKKSFETNDPYLIEGATLHAFFNVEYDEKEVPEQPGSQTVARDEAKRFNATKDITEDPKDPNEAAAEATTQVASATAPDTNNDSGSND